MNKTILKIANLISMSPQSGKESGLMGGKMGRTLFYYELSRMMQTEINAIATEIGELSK